MAIKLLERVRHNGIQYEPGDVIGDITATQAQTLIDSNSAVNEGDAEAKGGKPAPKKPSRVRDTLKANKKPGERKSVAEKAQAREEAKTAEAKDADNVNSDTPDPSETLDQYNDEGDQPDAPDTTSNDDPESPTEPAGADGFILGEDEFTSKVTSSGQTQYRKNGGLISKLDYKEAANQAGIEIED